MGTRLQDELPGRLGVSIRHKGTGEGDERHSCVGVSRASQPEQDVPGRGRSRRTDDRPDPDPDLYAKTIAEALDEGIPLVVSFATPAYCKTATCGPQLDTLKQLKTTHSERVNFIHVEVYDNPPEIRESGISVAKLSPTLAEWGLPTEPWTFVIDAEGIVRAKYEGSSALRSWKRLLARHSEAHESHETTSDVGFRLEFGTTLAFPMNNAPTIAQSDSAPRVSDRRSC